MLTQEPLIAVFVDYDNLAIGARDLKGGGDFKIQLVLKRLLEKGRIVYKRAYCDWSKHQNAMREFHASGMVMIDIPQSLSGKNNADIHMVIDALELCYAKQHIDIFALLSGDSDFTPLISKLKENNKYVISCGVKSSTSHLLISSCDEFIYYDDLVREEEQKLKKKRKKGAKEAAGEGEAKNQEPEIDHAGDFGQELSKEQREKAEVAELLVELVSNLEKDYEIVWSSMLKQALRRVLPGFNEAYYGYKSFTELLMELKAKGLLAVDFDEERSNFRVKSH